MNITTLNQTNTPVTIKLMGNASYPNAKDMVKVERVVLSSKFKVVTSLIQQIRFTGGGKTYTTSPFQTSYTSTNSYDYWILLANNQGFTAATVSVNNNVFSFNSANMGTPQKINSTFLTTNSTIPNQYFNNTVTFNGTGSFPSSLDLYIVQTPKNTGALEITSDTVKLKPSTFDFYLWVS